MPSVELDCIFALVTLLSFPFEIFLSKLKSVDQKASWLSCFAGTGGLRRALHEAVCLVKI